MPLAHSRLRPRPPAVWLALAGIETGVFAGLASLSYHALDGVLSGAGVWRYANLFAAAFHPDSAWTSEFSAATITGLGWHLVVAAAAGLVLTPGLAAVWDRAILSRLAALMFAVAWYYLTFRFVWPSWNPELVLQQPFPGVLFGHVIFGFSMGLYPRFLRLLHPPRGPSEAAFV